MSKLPERLAREAWESCGHGIIDRGPNHIYADMERYAKIGVCQACVAAAIRTALDEAAKVRANLTFSFPV